MNLKDILAAKTSNTFIPTEVKNNIIDEIEEWVELTEKQNERNNINDFILKSNATESEVDKRVDEETRLTVFLYLYYRGHGKDVYIRHGEGACLLYNFLGCPRLSTDDFPAIPLGHSIRDAYIFQSVLGIPDNVVYYIMKKISIDKKFPLS